MSTVTNNAEFGAIPCPNCGTRITIGDALRKELTERTEATVRAELARAETSLAARQAEVASRETNVARAEVAFDDRLRVRLLHERQALEAETRATARAEVEGELESLRKEAAEKTVRLNEASRSELLLRQQRRALQEQKDQLELEVARRIDGERAGIRDEAIRQTQEDQRLKDAEKDRRLQDALRINEDLRRRLQQGSQQTQGEVLEASLEDLLKAQFPLDRISPVPKGVNGADLLQYVYTRSGQSCGSILWETKNTKNWSDTWIPKLKDDQRDARADVAVLVSTAMPKDISGCGVRDGVWVVDARVALGLAMALRQGLVEVAVVKRAVGAKDESVQVLFTYLTGPEFRNRADAVIRTFAGLQVELEEEKRSMARRWAKREKAIGRAAESMSAIYGDLQGLLGSSMQTIPALESADGDGSNLAIEDSQEGTAA
jgi:hypothetical protein